MFWGGFGYLGKLQLIKTPNRLDSLGYQRILDQSLLIGGPNVTVNGHSGYIFQQDNASIHTSVSTEHYLSQLENVQFLDWPARSPDLNPMENIWGVLARRVYIGGKQYSSIDELEVAVYQAWDSIDDEILKSHINSMPNRMGEVLVQRGKITHY